MAKRKGPLSSKYSGNLLKIAGITLLILGLGLIIFFTIRYTYFTKNKIGFTNSGGQCQLYGTQPIQDYSESYTIKKGDTLLSLTQDALGDTSRVNEVVHLNKQRYPSLSLENPFIEVGWELLLPPSDVKRSSGYLMVVSGKLVDDEEGKYSILTSSSGGTVTYYVYTNNDTVYKNSNLTTGDCITVLYDSKPLSGGSQAMVVSLQKD